MKDLFREDMLRLKHLDWLGPSRVAVPPSQKLIALATLALSIGLALALFFAQYERKDHVRGFLTSSYPPIEIYAPEQGRISKVLVKKGEPIVQGQPLIYVETESPLQIGSKNYAVVSPTDGVVVSIGADPGSQVVSGQHLLELETPGSKLIAEFPIQGKDVGYLKPGERIALRYEDFPYQKFGLAYGSVEFLNINESGAQGAAPYLLKVSLEKKEISSAGHTIPLTKGLVVNTDIPLEKRNLIGWIFNKAN